jgi:DNA-binding transcriptional MerR regulator/methylmalonyl-CoA mutase cobalamin-binding subunit
MAATHSAMKAVVRRTGLTAHVIRVWQKRYGAVEPARTGTNRRLFSEAQIGRLILLRDLRRDGYGIGHLARLPDEKLRQLARAAADAGDSPTPPAAGLAAAASFLDECLKAVKALDVRRLDRALDRGSAELGAQGLLRLVVAPLALAIGDLWRDGTITAAHEHFASAAIHVFLGRSSAAFGGGGDAPALVVVTPAGQLHELGALLAGASAANLGWRVVYLGASLPAAEIAGAARQCGARAVALSLVYPEDDPRLAGELTRLRELLPPQVSLLAGGRAVPAYRRVLKRIGARETNSLENFAAVLDELRKPARKSRR